MIFTFLFKTVRCIQHLVDVCRSGLGNAKPEIIVVTVKSGDWFWHWFWKAILFIRDVFRVVIIFRFWIAVILAFRGVISFLP